MGTSIIRKKHSAKFKAKVAIEAMSQLKTVAEIAQEYQINPSLVGKWKKILEDSADMAFNDKRNPDNYGLERQTDELYKQVGKLQVENDWLKKKVGYITERTY